MREESDQCERMQKEERVGNQRENRHDGRQRARWPGINFDLE